MPNDWRDRQEPPPRREDRARKRGLDYLLGRDDDRSPRVRPSVGRDRYEPVRPETGRRPAEADRSDRPGGQPGGLRVSAPESFDVPCQTDVRSASGDSRKCGAPAREYRVYMQGKWERWVVCAAHAAYYRSWGADLSVLVD